MKWSCTFLLLSSLSSTIHAASIIKPAYTVEVRTQADAKRILTQTDVARCNAYYAAIRDGFYEDFNSEEVGASRSTTAYCSAKYLIEKAVANRTDFKFNLNPIVKPTEQECSIIMATAEVPESDFKGECAVMKSHKNTIAMGLLRLLTVSYQNTNAMKQAELDRFVAIFIDVNMKLEKCVDPENVGSTIAQICFD